MDLKPLSKMKLLTGALALSVATLPAWADGAQVPRAQRVRSGLVAPDRASREEAARVAREWARSDPMGVAALLPELDLRGRATLLRAMAGAASAPCTGTG